MQNTRRPPWIRTGGFGSSRFARSGVTFSYVWAPRLLKQTNKEQTSPPDQKLPRIVSRLHTLENESKICHQAFPPGKYFSIPPLPNVTAVNELGDFSIAKDRLAIIDGEGASVCPCVGTLHFLPVQPLIAALLPPILRSMHTHATLSSLPSPPFRALFPDHFPLYPFRFDHRCYRPSPHLHFSDLNLP